MYVYMCIYYSSDDILLCGVRGKSNLRGRPSNINSNYFPLPRREHVSSSPAVHIYPPTYTPQPYNVIALYINVYTKNHYNNFKSSAPALNCTPGNCGYQF